MLKCYWFKILYIQYYTTRYRYSDKYTMKEATTSMILSWKRLHLQTSKDCISVYLQYSYIFTKATIYNTCTKAGTRIYLSSSFCAWMCANWQPTGQRPRPINIFCLRHPITLAGSVFDRSLLVTVPMFWTLV